MGRAAGTERGTHSRNPRDSSTVGYRGAVLALVSVCFPGLLRTELTGVRTAIDALTRIIQPL